MTNLTSELLVSIIIPCYNVSGYVESTLNSCLLQTYPHIEIIVINDGSTDDTFEIADNYSKLYSHIIIINKDNEGVAKARKVGLDAAKGDYIFFLDSDDSLPLDSINELVIKIESSNADIVIGNYQIENTKGYQINNDYFEGNINGASFINKILSNRILTLWGKLYRKSIFNSSINYYEGWKWGEDTLVLVQLALAAKSVSSVNKLVYNWRYRNSSASRNPNNKLLFYQLLESRFIIDEYAIKNNIVDDNRYCLSQFVCFNLTLFASHPVSTEKINVAFIKNKIETYLLSNKEFAKFYKRESPKNYYRIILYYRLSLSNFQFSVFYKAKSLIAKSLKRA